MDRKFHRIEYNIVLSETATLHPRFNKLAFSDARAIDEALQRISSAAGRDSPSSQLAHASTYYPETRLRIAHKDFFPQHKPERGRKPRQEDQVSDSSAASLRGTAWPSKPDTQS